MRSTFNRKDGLIVACACTCMAAVVGWLATGPHGEEGRMIRDVEYVRDLCAKYGGDKTYKTVDGVEGVFQMRARNPDDAQLRDQGAMFDPWGFAQGDQFEGSIPIGYSAGMYRFQELQPKFGETGPPYRRVVGVDTGIARVDPTRGTGAEPVRRTTIWEKKTISVSRLRSKYGYITEDITTPEMRRRWIGGGRIKIIDLESKEVLAERTGYFRAIGPSAKMSWSGGSAYQNQRICPLTSLTPFLRAVLKPLPPAADRSTESISFLRD